ncbi:hypothetical protein [Sphingomonas montanisoli]|uniref:Uncharacterized protein n=1 Tax=Sphingomonas montanisoli TaxID=2606412 RepID=A0A5D9C184_9SPHN|nr:hypothetical protein [Sphingomonas montanisoli]TZG25052.1 hypothetical protein FYJ91_17465 [Sphingomonas montanisoli]
MKIGFGVFGAVLIVMSGAAVAQNTSSPSQQNGFQDASKKAGRIASQPGRDIGAVKTKIPPVLQSARDNPYAISGMNCTTIAKAITGLNGALGADFVAGPAAKENRGGKIAEAGGQTIVNSLIPFRGLVREATGAAPAQRRLNAAIDAGYARRGFLRGVHLARKCRTKY